MLDAKKNKGTPQRYLGNSNVRWGEFDLLNLGEMRFQPSEEDRYSLRTGDLVVCEGGEPGRCAIWTGPPGMKIQKALHRIRPKETLDNYYLFYWFCHAAKTGQLDTHFTGTTIKHLTGRAIAALQVPLPPISTQQALVAVLKCLDDRISLLRETNATLEAIAQALFQSWFVDFDPVRAKTRGGVSNGSEQSETSIFPATVTDGVPLTWSVAGLDEIATYLNGLALQKFPATGQADLPVIKIAQLRKGDTVGADLASGAIKPDFIVKDGDVLFSWSGSLEVGLWCGGRGALNQHLFKVTSTRFPKWFYYLWTRHHLPDFRRIAASKATTMGHIQRSHLTAAKVVVPTEAVLKYADEVLSPLLDRVVANTLQARELTALRDTLLPRLIFGRLRLPEAKSLVERAL
jgi:type I restriction enzyme S subunit